MSKVPKHFNKLEVVSIGNRRHLILLENPDFKSDETWWVDQKAMSTNRYMIYVEEYTSTQEQICEMGEAFDIFTAYIIFNKIRKSMQKISSHQYTLKSLENLFKSSGYKSRIIKSCVFLHRKICVLATPGYFIVVALSTIGNKKRVVYVSDPFDSSLEALVHFNKKKKSIFMESAPFLSYSCSFILILVMSLIIALLVKNYV